MSRVSAAVGSHPGRPTHSAARGPLEEVRHVRIEGREAIRAFLEEITTGGTLRVELSNLADEGGNVSYSYQFLQGGRVSISGDDGYAVVTGGQIVFDGTRGGWTLECIRDASQAFCAGY